MLYTASALVLLEEEDDLLLRQNIFQEKNWSRRITSSCRETSLKC